MTLERWVALAIGLCLLGAAVITALQSRQRGDGAVTALGVFSFVWGCALMLFAIPLVRYTTTPVGVWLMVYGSIVTFAVGCLLAERRFRDMPHIEPEQRQRPDGKRLRLTWIFFSLLGLVGFAAYVHAVDVAIGWRFIIDNPELVRGIQTSSVNFADAYGPWKLLTYFNQVAFVLWTLALRERAFQGRWRVAWILGPFSLAPFLFTGDRTLIMASLLWAAAFQVMYLPPVRLKRLLVGSVASVITLVFLFGVLGGRVGKTVEGQPQIASSLTTRSFDQLALPYVYATANVPAFAGLVDDPLRPDTRGQLTLLSGVKLLHGLGLWGQPPETVGAFYPIPFETFNNYSWLGIFYSDFGIVGVLLLPLLFAYLTTAVVLRAIRKRTLLSVWTASLLLYCVIFTFDGYKFFDTLVSEYLLLGLFVVPIIRRDVGPGEIIRRLRGEAKARPRLAGAGAMAIAGFVAISFVGLSSSGPSEGLPSSERALTEKLRNAANLADVTAVDGDYPTSEALASRLHVNDPAIRYVGLPALTSISEPDTIGVFTQGGRLMLRAQSSLDRAMIFDNKSVGPRITSLVEGRAPLDKELVSNGSFENGLSGWEVIPGDVAQVSITGLGREGRRAAAIVGSGSSGSPMILAQTRQLTAPEGACFRFSVWSRTRNLDRPLLVWAALIHADGAASPQLVAGNNGGVGPGSSPWQRWVETGRLTQSIVNIRLFAADTGEQPITGTAEIDDISLRRTC